MNIARQASQAAKSFSHSFPSSPTSLIPPPSLLPCHFPHHAHYLPPVLLLLPFPSLKFLHCSPNPQSYLNHSILPSSSIIAPFSFILSRFPPPLRFSLPFRFHPPLPLLLPLFIPFPAAPNLLTCPLPSVSRPLPLPTSLLVTLSSSFPALRGSPIVQLRDFGAFYAV